MGLVSTETFMEQICSHCDSHIEMCDECLFKTIINKIEIKHEDIPHLRKLVAIKTSIKIMPEQCDDCIWYTTRPHPFKGWTDGCELMNHCMDDDQPKEWIYDGNGRPSACPLIEITDAVKGEQNDEE